MKAVCLLSGGLDSSTCLGVATRDGFECYALSFDYGLYQAFLCLSAGATLVVAPSLRIGADLVGTLRRHRITVLPGVPALFASLIALLERQPKLELGLRAATNTGEHMPADYVGRLLARMPQLARRAFPWLRIERRRIYAVGESMGGQETLLLVAHDPRLLAGAAAFDAPTNMDLRYRDFRLLRRGLRLQRLARFEIGGPPWLSPRHYAERSPLALARRIALSGVALELWWSRDDRVVTDQAAQSGLLYRTIERLRPHAPVRRFVGRWAHGAEFRRCLPEALERLGLLL